MSSRTFKTQAGFAAFMEEQRRRGGIWHVTVLHDHGCSPSRCTCKPFYKVEPATEEVVREGARAQAQWTKESSS